MKPVSPSYTIIRNMNWTVDRFAYRQLCGAEELISSLRNESVESNVNERAIVLIIIAIGDKPLRSIQECKTAKAA